MRKVCLASRLTADVHIPGALLISYFVDIETWALYSHSSRRRGLQNRSSPLMTFPTFLARWSSWQEGTPESDSRRLKWFDLAWTSHIQAILPRNAKVYIACRNEAKAKAAIEKLREATGKDALYLPLDLASFKSIQAAASDFLRLVTGLLQICLETDRYKNS